MRAEVKQFQYEVQAYQEDCVGNIISLFEDFRNEVPFTKALQTQLEPVISSITIERLKRAGQSIAQKIEEENTRRSTSGEDPKPMPDLGFKVFDSTEAPQLELNEEEIVFPELSNDALSLIYNMIFTVGIDEPTQAPEVVVEDAIYKIGHYYYITNSHSLTPEQYAMAIKNGKVFIDGWTASLNGTMQSYKEEVKIVF
ncbi:hypothetical protein PG630_01025 [Riemerella anatipestifer]|nr:hypothetical protein [Riemerella anatipestifer]